MIGRVLLTERLLYTRVRMMAGRIIHVTLGMPKVEMFKRKKNELLAQFKEQHSAMFSDGWKVVYA